MRAATARIEGVIEIGSFRPVGTVEAGDAR
jgi:hypothetical protein